MSCYALPRMQCNPLQPVTHHVSSEAMQTPYTYTYPVYSNKTQLSFLRCDYIQEPINFSHKVWRYLHKPPSVVYVLNIQSTMRQHWPNRSSKSTSCWYSRSLVPTVVHVYWPFAQTCLSCFIQPVTALDCMS